jgi:YYY domain-containing protein
MSESTLTGQPIPAEPETIAPTPTSWADQLRRVGALLSAKTLVPFWFFLIILLGGVFRFTGIDWDEGHHLHPDERFLSSVVADIQWPQQDFLKSYFDEATSTLNPRNVGKTFFVYGDFPITMAKGITVFLDAYFPKENSVSWQGYGENYKVGRVLDGIMDMGTLIMLFFVAKQAYKDNRIALLASLLYAGTALAIQQAHFFVVDSFTAFFVTVAIFFMVRLSQHGRWIDYILAGAFVGISLATKLSIFTLAGVVALVGLYRFWVESKEQGVSIALERVALRLMVSGAMALLMFRIFQPTAFSGPLEISQRWWDNAQEARAWVSGDRDAPFAHQWTDRTPILFPLQNMIQWGMGVPLGITAWVAWVVALLRMVRSQRWVHLVPVAWVGILFLHQGTQWVKSMRYFLPIYPILILLAAWLLIRLFDGARKTAPYAGEGKIPGRVWLTGILATVVTVSTLIYGAGFTSIYTRPHTRIAASEWIYDNVPEGSIIANETGWDDGLPLSRPNRPYPFPDYFVSRVPLVGADISTIPVDQQASYLVDSTLDITAEDDEAKWYGRDDPATGLRQPGIFDKLDQIEYYFISSNRQYDSMSRLPMRYPAVIEFYDALFSGELGFERVAEFTSYPSFLGIPLPDQGAEEAWHVYDHNRVQIWRKTDAYSREKAEELILGDVDLDNVVQLWPKEANGWKGNLQFTREEEAQYAAGGTWAQIFNRTSLQNQMPVVVWVLALQLFGLIALPYLRTVAGGLPDKGYFFAKALGLLMATWVVWMIASAKWMEFTALSISLSILLLALGGILLLWREAGYNVRAIIPSIREWWMKDLRLLLLAEGVFWAFFALVLAIRFANPDLWHQDLGGEKPMDFAYLNAVIKSTYFPPMDPWFAGGYINYYYYGFIIVAVITKFTGVIPSVAYNLIIPTLFSMMATGVFGVALALQVPLKVTDEGRMVSFTRPMLAFALVAALFVGVLGNLGEWRVLSENLGQLSQIQFESGIPGLETTIKSVDGLVRGMIIEGQPMPGRAEWPYWNPTRTIASAPINEFPWFTFLYADLHAHMMALPYTVLAIGMALAVMRTRRQDSIITEVIRLGLMALVLGALWPINTWDFPTYALIAFAGLGLREWRHTGKITVRGVISVAWRWALVIVLSRLLFQPFHSAYGAAYSSVEHWTGDRTTLSEFFTIHGMFLLAIAFALINDFAFGKGHNGIVRLARFTFRMAGKRQRASHLYRTLVQKPFALPLSSFYPILFGVLVITAAAIVAQWGVPALTFVLLLFAMLLFFREKPQPLWQMVLFFIILGLGLTCAVELVVLKGDIGRMNTVFKFYLQVWVLWGTAAALGIGAVLPTLTRWLPEWRTVYRFSMGLLIFGAVLYPIFATNAKINDRFDRTMGPGLDGAAFMEKANIRIAVVDGGEANFEAKWDADAMRWMQDNIPGSPVIAEMNTAPRTLYGWGNRFAMFTGNPAIIGWDHHQRQQRAAARGDEEINSRVSIVREEIYRTPDAELAYETLLKYNAEYVILGPLERAFAPNEDGIAKWDANRGKYWDLVYENPEVKIYRVILQPDTALR